MFFLILYLCHCQLWLPFVTFFYGSQKMLEWIWYFSVLTLTHPRKILTLTDFINRKAITYFFLFYHHSPYFLVVSVRQRDLVFDIPLGKIGGIWLGGWGLFSFYLRFLNLGNLFQSSFITSILFVIKIYEWETMKTLACYIEM